MTINKKTFWISIIATLVVGLLAGWLIFSSGKTSAENEHEHTETAAGEETIWTCSMHPQIRQSEPGDCPICGMDLIPLEDETGSEMDPMAISMSPTAMQLANVRTAVAGSMKPLKKVRLNGKVQEDERLVFSQTSHIPGRIEKLNVNFTGEFVQKGQLLAYIYSPDLVTAQEEVFEARKIKESQPALYRSAIEKLRNWKLSESQIERIVNADETIENFPIVADVSGYVISKKVNLGDYIRKGQPIYEIADLSKVWVLFDVYESDLPWIDEGDQVNFTVQSLPGEQFSDKITFLDPVLNPKTRVAKARVEMRNPNNKLKPEMFASGVVGANLEYNKEALVIPKSAVMWTGERSVVYVKSSSAQGVNFMMREVVLGPELGEGFVVEEGLEPGEEIAVSGTFSIDAAAQLAGKPSMMNPEGGPAMTGHNHGDMGGPPAGSGNNHAAHNKDITIGSKAKEALKPVIDAYLDMKDALVNDDATQAQAYAQKLKEELGKINMALFTGESHNVWMKHSTALKTSTAKASITEDIEELRASFIEISSQLKMLVETFRPYNQTLYVQFCPMANNNRGANWLSLEREVKNPYFGEAMLSCGEVKATISEK
ncbi:MAG: efflux RND transporter periplasmic adaptor subunit [Cyclobacteriaceae bacterium]|nr:efflux RND transporter periplasmic adaptor subunit [Cyclobacteriaceae bacterium]